MSDTILNANHLIGEVIYHCTAHYGQNLSEHRLALAGIFRRRLEASQARELLSVTRLSRRYFVLACIIEFMEG